MQFYLISLWLTRDRESLWLRCLAGGEEQRYDEKDRSGLRFENGLINEGTQLVAFQTRAAPGTIHTNRI